MRIVIDTNIVASGMFFRGAPEKVLEAITSGEFDAYVTSDILEEYNETVEELKGRYAERLDDYFLNRFLLKVHIIKPTVTVNVCRDPDDDKFLSCAVSAKALYIVSGDKDLLSLTSYEDVEIITAREFCNRYLNF